MSVGCSFDIVSPFVSQSAELVGLSFFFAFLIDNLGNQSIVQVFNSRQATLSVKQSLSRWVSRSVVESVSFVVARQLGRSLPSFQPYSFSIDWSIVGRRIRRMSVDRAIVYQLFSLFTCYWLCSIYQELFFESVEHICVPSFFGCEQRGGWRYPRNKRRWWGVGEDRTLQPPEVRTALSRDAQEQRCMCVHLERNQIYRSQIRKVVKSPQKLIWPTTALSTIYSSLHEIALDIFYMGLQWACNG